MRAPAILVALLALVAAPADAQEPTRSCWCFHWVHGNDHGADCFNTRPLCRRARARRGNSGDSTPCRHEAHSACERRGVSGDRGVNLGPSRPRIASLLGQPRARLQRTLGSPTRTEAGWTRYGPRLAIRFAAGRAVRIRARVPDGLSCSEAAEREGFSDAGPPLRRSDACEWPGQSPRHRLDPQGRFAARLDLETATLDVRLRSRR